MLNKKLILLFLLTLKFVSMSPSLKKCSHLNGCSYQTNRYLSFYNGFRTNAYVKCDLNHKSPIGFNLTEPYLPNTCDFKAHKLTVELKNSPLALDSSFSNIFYILNLSKSKSALLYIFKIKKVSLESRVEVPLNWTSGFLDLHILDSTLVYIDSNGRTIETCQDFEPFYSPWSSNFFIKSNFTFYLTLMNVAYKKPVCELIFHNALVVSIQFGYVFDSFFKTNIPIFTASCSSNVSLVSNLTYLRLYSYNIDFDSRLFNSRVFKNLKQAILKGRFRSIQTGLFTVFRRLVYIEIFYSNFENLARHQGIEWMQSLNVDLDVDLNNETNVNEYKNRITSIVFDYQPDIVLRSSYLDMFRDEDLCIYVNFPFRQLVFVDVTGSDYTHNMTCLYFWLFRFHSSIEKNGLNHFLVFEKAGFDELIESINNSSRCNFSRLFSLCRKKDFKTNSSIELR